MVVGAHPDDAEIMAGGTMARIVREGGEAKIVVVTDGSLGGDPEERLREQETAAKRIGAEISTLGFRDGELKLTSKLVSAIRREIVDFHPDIVITHNPHELHQDHRTVYKAITASTTWRALEKANVVVGENIRQNGFTPSVYIDISDYMEAKISALQAHRSQVQRGSINIRYVKTLNALRGEEIGTEYAEAFAPLRLRIDQIWKP